MDQRTANSKEGVVMSLTTVAFIMGFVVGLAAGVGMVGVYFGVMIQRISKGCQMPDIEDVNP